jgi:ABC-2 type transport system ATP-binding protein
MGTTIANPNPGSALEFALPAANAPTVVVSELTKRFSSRSSVREMIGGRFRKVATVVDQVSFEVDEGEIFGVLGPNGAGKTTIFKMLSTLVVPDDGYATVCGNDIWTEPARVRSRLAAVSSDERSLNWRLSARENLLLFAALHKVPRREADGLVGAMLKRVGLEGSGHKMVAAFSSGMRQRLLIARSMLARPKVLLLDEPTRALDPISAQELRQFLRNELVDRQRCTIVLATHNAEEAFGFCDRIVVLNKGRVLATGTPSDLRARYGEERFRIVTTDPDHPCFGRLEAMGVMRRLVRDVRTADGWHTLECSITGDASRTAIVLEMLYANGVRVARLERVEPSLADLIARIIEATSKGISNA